MVSQSKISSKEWIIFLLTLLISIILFILSKFDLFGFHISQEAVLMISSIIVVIIAIFAIIRKRLNEINEELEVYEIEQKRLSEKLKIHELLIEMKGDITNLKNKVFKK